MLEKSRNIEIHTDQGFNVGKRRTATPEIQHPAQAKRSAGKHKTAGPASVQGKVEALIFDLRANEGCPTG
jgi:hypothetical protein